ncbi:hypothetical protein WBJ53_25555 [Spirosoma sp. SC4-14]|uniref:hypothetical protein n=1 Tax=Spirosoma sp. SC4-14 TaxID=3128900 RepID=UPI0030CCF187
MLNSIETEQASVIMNALATLTAKELTRYLGRKVQIWFPDYTKHGEIGILQYVRDKIEGNPMTPTVGVLLEGDSFPRAMNPQHVRPILRRLVGLTEAEAKQCFRLGYPYWDQRESVRLLRGKTHVELVSGPIRLLITTQGVVTSERHMDGVATPARVNALGLLNYLDRLFIDTRGYIESELAMAAE